MPRLPEPGKDAGQWGNILNEYLGASLAIDGTLKTDTVGAPQLKANSVTNTAITNGTIQENKLHADVQTKLNAVGNGAVTSVATKTGAVTLDKADVGLGAVNNTSDADKPISTAVQTALTSGLAGKVNTTSVGAANGVATLDGTTKLPESQVPDRLSDSQLSATYVSYAPAPTGVKAGGSDYPGHPASRRLASAAARETRNISSPTRFIACGGM
jgi:hypothetical protein